MEPIFTALWVMLGVLFLAIEIPAIRRKEHGDTLTDHVRFLLKDRRFAVLFGAFWVWLTLHFFVPDLGI